MNDLYGIQVPRAIGEGFSFDSSVLADALRAIYVSSDLDPLTELDPGLFQETARIITQATDKGISQSAYDPDHAFRNALQHSNEVFAAFKVHRLQRDMAAQLLDSNGNLKSFKQWSEDVAPIASHQVGSWLQTEYDTAIIRAHQAADWQQFQAEKDILPNLKWMPSTSAHPGADHQVFWNTVRPVDDSFWNDHRPGDRWNCKCSLSSTTDPVTPIPDGKVEGGTAPGSDSHQGLKTKAGSPQVFSQDHPYFPDDCSSCPFHANSPRSNGFSRWLPFRNRAKDCYNCQFINGCIDRAEEKKKIANVTFAKVREVKEQNQMPEYDMTEVEQVQTGKLSRTRKQRDKLLDHCFHDYDVEAAVHIWNNPNDLVFVRESPLGEGKDLTDPEEVKKLKKKKKELKVTTFNQYEFTFGGKTFVTKLGQHREGYEFFYSLMEK